MALSPSIRTTLLSECVPAPAVWTTVGSNTILSDRWIRVRADTCVTSEGREIAPYYVLEYPDWINVVAFNADGKVLLVHEYKHGVGRVCLGLPGGVVDATDASLESAARRELIEETGHVAGTLVRTVTMTVNPAIQSNVGYGYVAFGCSASQAPDRDQLESIEPILHDFDSLLAAYLRREIVLSGFDGASLWQAAIVLMKCKDSQLAAVADATRRVFSRLVD
jgi:8-oxo-dGTP pyrophosphatase MutT (NUDIX family)